MTNACFVISTIFLLFLSWFCRVQSDTESDLKYLKQHVDTLSKQVMLQQFFSEQRVRSEGQSGVKINRLRRSGYKNYFSETHTGYSACSIHDHSNNIRTVGLGELIAVLNGVEFTTRHNDYRLYMPHRTSKEYHAVEEIPFPDVPPEVTSKATVSEQIDEMKEWFKAWQDEDHSKRDYRKYFKPTLCYLEGGWTKTTDQNVEEPFDSDRHFVDAATWMELHNKARFVAYSGSKSLLENLSFLPTKIIGFKDGVPIFAQWNYRILCHPLKDYLSVKELQVVEDLSSRMMTRYNIYRHSQSRAARFQLKPKNKRPNYDADKLEELMNQIPGKDNYQGKLHDEGLDTAALHNDTTMKDASKYHRKYIVEGKDAMGEGKMQRGFSDNFFFAAMTSQSKIASMDVEKCKDNRRKKDCKTLTQKWTYAIPLEIIYLTPLSKWNPYNLKYHGKNRKGSPATLGGRYGHCNASKHMEFNGTNSQRYYITPFEFFERGGVKTPADTARYDACVLDEKGVSHMVRASGTYMMLPYIKDVGLFRQRYPIFPVHGEGSSLWKEVNALRDIVMDMKKYQTMLWDPDVYIKNMETNTTELMLLHSDSPHTSTHVHYVEITLSEIIYLKGFHELTKTTSVANGHQHVLRMRWYWKNKTFYYVFCDGRKHCFDKHPKTLSITNSAA